MINKSINAFSDVEAAFERALAAPKGIRIPCKSHGSAVGLRQRFNYYRKLDRLKNIEVYPPDDPRHGLTIYDSLELRIPPKGAADEHILYIEPRSVDNLTIEDIT